MPKFTGRCYGGPRNGEIVTSTYREWRAPVPKPRPARAMDMWKEDPISMEPFETLTYRVDRVIEDATSKRGTVMFREVKFWVCDGHNLTAMERSRILTDMRRAGWQRQQTTPNWNMSSREYNLWLEEVRSWGYRQVIMSSRKHFPIEHGPYVEIESLLYYGPALPLGFLVKI